ncbi:helix-turn-helix domain-containing protein [Fuscovulum ytuae]|uniref:helix-turn-helix domain-containing protein n=1 Tax=Fuscovulum ytuae TaxID=3042299 RepID=UPI003B20EA44
MARCPDGNGSHGEVEVLGKGRHIDGDAFWSRQSGAPLTSHFYDRINSVGIASCCTKIYTIVDKARTYEVSRWKFNDRRNAMRKAIQSSADLGAAIRERRKDLGLLQAELAMQSGITSATLSAIENGKETARIGLVLQICRDLGLRLEVKA